MAINETEQAILRIIPCSYCLFTVGKISSLKENSTKLRRVATANVDYKNDQVRVVSLDYFAPFYYSPDL